MELWKKIRTVPESNTFEFKREMLHIHTLVVYNKEKDT